MEVDLTRGPNGELGAADKIPETFQISGVSGAAVERATAAAVLDAMHTDAGGSEKIPAPPRPVEARGHFVGEPDSPAAVDDGVTAVAEATCVSAEESAVELHGA